jgi:Family of unknown function (DUF6511)
MRDVGGDDFNRHFCQTSKLSAFSHDILLCSVVHEALTELGLMEHFFDLTAEQIDQLIEAAVDGFQQSMQCQALNDDLPF